MGSVRQTTGTVRGSSGSMRRIMDDQNAAIVGISIAILTNEMLD